jgi:hypothetical protein
MKKLIKKQLKAWLKIQEPEIISASVVVSKTMYAEEYGKCVNKLTMSLIEKIKDSGVISTETKEEGMLIQLTGKIKVINPSK